MRSLRLPAQVRGSSLVETLVAAALGLLVLVLSTKSVLAVAVGENNSVAAKELLKSVEFARTEAAQRRSPVAICGLDPSDAAVSSGQVHCAPSGAPWHAGWIVYGDANLNGELDDGEAVLQVSRGTLLAVQPEGSIATAAAITFRPMGTLASATPRRLLIGADGAQAAPSHAVCVGIDGYTRMLPVTAACQ
jgi:type IV fimbrial biogenesis protein FimT